MLQLRGCFRADRLTWPAGNRDTNTLHEETAALNRTGAPDVCGPIKRYVEQADWPATAFPQIEFTCETNWLK